MCGGIVAALIAGDGDPGYIHNGALAGLVAVCAGSDVMHPIGSLLVGGVAGALFVYAFQRASDPRWNFDDVLGVWALHGLCGLWGGIACGIFGLKAFGGLGGVSFASQLVGSLMGAVYGALAGLIVYGIVDVVLGLRLSPDDEHRGADLAVHKIGANPEQDVRMGRV
jgi:Amt family ammonium transporter